MLDLNGGNAAGWAAPPTHHPEAVGCEFADHSVRPRMRAVLC